MPWRADFAGAIRQVNAELEQRVVDRTAQWHASRSLLQAVMDGATDAVRKGRLLEVDLRSRPGCRTR
jgi:hypothetical protein